MIQPQQTSFNQKVNFENPYNIDLYVKREDVLHAEISGNKFRKLKYNLEEAKRLGISKLLTFGGAYSNHIAAVAAAGRNYGLDRKSTRLNSSHVRISYAVFCLKKKKTI